MQKIWPRDIPRGHFCVAQMNFTHNILREMGVTCTIKV
jgi:hypothetical protein